MAPERILLVGDTHGATPWFNNTLLPHIEATRPDLVIQLGDFGFWPLGVAGHRWLTTVEAAMARLGIEWWFVDGNHEDHEELSRLPVDPATGRRPVGTRVQHLPRGYRWAWGEATWLACGGAVSMDRAWRQPGLSWFPAEDITDADLEACLAGGPADVVVSHEIPDGGPWWRDWLARPSVWPADALADAAKTRARLARLADRLHPREWFHGHYHARVDDLVGSARLHGLACDGFPVTDATLLVGPDGLPARTGA